MKEYLKNQKIGERKTKRSSLVRTIAGLSIPILGFTCLLKITDDYLSTPVSKTYTNLNGDEREDLVVTNRSGQRFEYVQMEDGNYRFLSRTEKEAMKEEARMQFYLENNIEFSTDDF